MGEPKKNILLDRPGLIAGSGKGLDSNSNVEHDAYAILFLNSP